MAALTRKLFWLAFWVIGFAVFMTGLLLYFKYQSTFTGLQRERVLMVAREIEGVAGKNLSMGQDFREIGTLQDVIERRRSADALFTGIDVAGKDGRIAYSTDLARIGTTLPAGWVAAFARNAQVTSLVPSQDLAMVASTIRNGFDQPTGYAVIRYTRQPEHDAMSAFTRRLLATCASVFAVFTLVLFATLRACELHMERTFSRAAAVARAAPGAAGAHALSRELMDIQARADQADRALASVEEALEPTR